MLQFAVFAVNFQPEFQRNEQTGKLGDPWFVLVKPFCWETEGKSPVGSFARISVNKSRKFFYLETFLGFLAYHTPAASKKDI